MTLTPVGLPSSGPSRLPLPAHPSLPTDYRRFDATMGALTPARPALRLFEHEHRPVHRAGLTESSTRPSDRSASNHLMRPHVDLTRYPSSARCHNLLNGKLPQHPER